MNVIEVSIPEDSSVAGAKQVIERGCAEMGLQVTLKGTLSKYPGCIHWHLKQGQERGTLEITLWPEQRRLWLSVQNGRKGEWIDAAAERLKSMIEAGF
jgi:hypothetical protein